MKFNDVSNVKDDDAPEFFAHVYDGGDGGDVYDAPDGGSYEARADICVSDLEDSVGEGGIRYFPNRLL